MPRLSEQERSALRVEQARLHKLNLYLREDIPQEDVLIKHNEKRINFIERQIEVSNRLAHSKIRSIK